MIGPKVMTRDIEFQDPLSWAIGEFREELLLWIDTELVRLQEREPADDSVIEEEPLRRASLNSTLRAAVSGRVREVRIAESGIARQELADS